MLDELDTLVNDVAKTMTSAPPRDGFARRVAARIAADRRGDGNRRPWLRPWVMVPIAAAAVVVVAVFVARLGGPERAAPQVRPVVERPFQGRGHVANAPGDQPVERPFQGRGGGADDRDSRDPKRVALRKAVRDPKRVALQTIEPIEVDRLDVQPLVEMDMIQITPIAIDRIDIAAMP